VKCDTTGCSNPATRIYREDDPQSRIVRNICKACGKRFIDTTILKKSRGKGQVQRLPHLKVKA